MHVIIYLAISYLLREWVKVKKLEQTKVNNIIVKYFTAAFLVIKSYAPLYEYYSARKHE